MWQGFRCCAIKFAAIIVQVVQWKVIGGLIISSCGFGQTNAIVIWGLSCFCTLMIALWIKQCSEMLIADRSFSYLRSESIRLLDYVRNWFPVYKNANRIKSNKWIKFWLLYKLHSFERFEWKFEVRTFTGQFAPNSILSLLLKHSCNILPSITRTRFDWFYPPWR